MTDTPYIRIDLAEVPSSGRLEFLYAEVLATATATGTSLSPFAKIHYAVDGFEQPYGLRFDLDKGVFLDHFDDDPEKEKALSSTASELASAVFSKASEL